MISMCRVREEKQEHVPVFDAVAESLEADLWVEGRLV